MTTRIHNWDIALVQAATATLGAPFVWGETDCGTLVFRRAMRAMYGADVFAWLGEWHDEPSALRVLARWGGMAKALVRVGALSGALEYAQSGDVILTPVHGESHEVFGMAGVMVSGQLWYVDIEQGVQCHAVPAEALAAAQVWRLPWTLTVPESV